MNLKDYLIRERETLIKKWNEAILNTYPPDSVKVLSRQKDRFQNPVGHNLTEGIKGLFSELLEDLDPANLSAPLDAVIRIRSVQDFSPSEAVACIFLLKGIIRKELKSEISDYKLFDELLEFESKIDRLALHAFDNYTQCREVLYNLRIREAKSGQFRMVDKLNRRLEARDDENAKE